MHKWEWRYLVLNGRIRRRGIAHPRRERMLARNALNRLGIRYKEIVPVFNKFHKNGTIQWIDFLIYSGGMMAILFALSRDYGHKQREKDALKAKTDLLISKHIPYLVLLREDSQQEMETKIRMAIALRKEAYGNKDGRT